MADRPLIDKKELIEFYNELGKVSPEIQKSMRRRLTQTAKPIVAEIKREVMSIPSGVESAMDAPYNYQNVFSLRSAIAQAIKARVSFTGKKGGLLTIQVRSSIFTQLSGKPRKLPYYMEGRIPRWRHPVFGNREVWVQQESHPFLSKVGHSTKNVDKVYDAIRDSIDDGLKVVTSINPYKAPPTTK